MSKTVIFGYPGTGKTTYLINILDKYLKEGIKPESICFCSYTKSAAEEIKDRASKKFNLKKEEMVYFGTIHSLCYKRFALNKEVIKQNHISTFFKLKSLEYDEFESNDEILVMESFGEQVGNKLINFYNLLRITECKNIYDIKDVEELKLIYAKSKMPDDYFTTIFSNVFNPHKILMDYEEYKNKGNLIDFTDMLLMALKSQWIVPTEILIVDEAQDLSPIQWALFDLWKQNKKEIYIAGDDDQSIYAFNGADPKRLIKEKETADKVEILSTTWRLSKVIHDYCLTYINSHIDSKNRIIKEVISLKEGGEIVEEYIDNDLQRVREFIRIGKSTFILFRTNNYKRQFVSEVLIPNGILYWEIRGQSIWNNKTMNLYNAIIKLSNNKSLNAIELQYLIESISSSFKLLKRGLKTNFKDMDKKVSYNLEDLLTLGFDMKIFDYLKDMKILNVLKITDNLKAAFLNKPNEEIVFPLNLYVGTAHSSKGKECDDVILFKDITKRIAKEITKDKQSWEDEIRVFHTAQTRAKERLVILRGGFDYSESDLIP